MYLYIYIYICTYIAIYSSIYICIFIYVYIYISPTYIYIYTYMNIYIYICRYISIYTHTYILYQNAGGTWSPQISALSHEVCVRTADCFKSAPWASPQYTPSWCIFAGVVSLRLSWNGRGRRYLSEWASEGRSRGVATISRLLKIIGRFCRT